MGNESVIDDVTANLVGDIRYDRSITAFKSLWQLNFLVLSCAGLFFMIES